jgi:hypothetical protein
MSECSYQVTINSIQTISCDYNFIVNESGEKIVHFASDALAHNFQSPYELDYIVNTDTPVCTLSEKSGYYAIVKNFQEKATNDVLDGEKYNAIFSQSTYRAEIKCASVDLGSI